MKPQSPISNPKNTPTSSPDANLSYATTMIHRLINRGFFGELVIRFASGRITNMRIEESLPLPSHRTDPLRTDTNNNTARTAEGEFNETNRNKK